MYLGPEEERGIALVGIGIFSLTKNPFPHAKSPADELTARIRWQFDIRRMAYSLSALTPDLYLYRQSASMEVDSTG
jgi:hypothetical protein